MPLHEYRCQDCHRVTSVLEYSWSEGPAPVCANCGGSSMKKLVSGFAFHRSWGESLNWSPGEDTMDDVGEDDAMGEDDLF